MRAIAVDKFGDKPTLHNLPAPEPGAGEVLIAVRAAGVNPFDWKVAQAPMGDQFQYHFPLILGFDAAGIVERVGPGVNDLKVGDEVYGQIRKPVFGEGTYANYVTAPVSVIAKKPRSLTFEQAAAVPMPAQTAMISIDTLQIGRGDRLLIVGATGGVGSYAVQLAAHRGSHVIATALPPDAAYMRDLGATETIDYKSNDLVKAVKAAHPEGIDAILDLVSDAATLDRIASTLKKGGRLATTLYVADEKAFAARGITASNIANQPSRSLLDRLSQMIDAGELKVPLQKTFLLEQAPEAISESRSGHVRGKMVLKVA